jgi:hypothetical protein
LVALAFADCLLDPELTSPGLYRIRRVGRDDLDYMGQTDLRLRRRLGMLKGVYRTGMPYCDPQTVGPALWAQRLLGGEEYEASTCPVVGDAPWRKALECVALAQYRQEHRGSPTLLERGPLSESCTFISYESVRALAKEGNLEYLSDRVLERYEEESEEDS